MADYLGASIQNPMASGQKLPSLSERTIHHQMIGEWEFDQEQRRKHGQGGARAADEKKADEVRVLRMPEVVTETEYFVIGALLLM